ncbi:hypothetical protein ACLIYP_05645 [Streptomyces nanhaiensis]|uniref:hypothetical protein n=1 Tax=Streptomyces nanhaiensis TaxID=679319 RepID=UPI00399CC90B
MASNLPTSGDVQNVVKTASTYARDLAERVVWTFVLAAAGAAVLAGPADVFSLSFWETVWLAGATAVGSLVKGLAARAVGPKNSASTAPGV